MKHNRKAFDPGAMSHLAAEVTPEDIAAMMADLRRMLQATKYARAMAAPGELPNGRRTKRVIVPDEPTRRFAIEMFARIVNYPTPTLKEVRVLHKKDQGPAPKNGAAALRELQAQGLDLRAVVETYVGQLETVGPAVEVAAVELPESQ